jgi:hypothetical protein
VPYAVRRTRKHVVNSGTDARSNCSPKPALMATPRLSCSLTALASSDRSGSSATELASATPQRTRAGREAIEVAVLRITRQKGGRHLAVESARVFDPSGQNEHERRSPDGVER